MQVSRLSKDGSDGSRWSSRTRTDSQNAPEGSSKHCVLAKPCLKALHFAISGGVVYNDHVRAQPMARLK